MHRYALMWVPALAISSAALGGMTLSLGGGWEAELLDDGLDLFTDYVSVPEDLLVIEKFATATEVDDITGTPNPLRILFRQVASDADTVSRIAITDETIINLTGLDWDGFRIGLLGDATFDPAASDDFSLDAFGTMDFTDDLKEAHFSDGLVADGDIWTPGFDSGALWIDVDLSGDAPASFILKELATVPAPGALALFGLALVGSRRRR